MASTNMKKTCIKCNKDVGTAICYGCEQTFCTKHFFEHRHELAQQMDNVTHEHDILQRDLLNDMDTHPLLSHINQWEQESIVKIQTAASSARANLQILIDQTKNDLRKMINKVAEIFQSSRESDDYTEIDIQKWREQLNEIRDKINHRSNLHVDYDNNLESTIRLIQVNDHKTRCSSRHNSNSNEETNSNGKKSGTLSEEKFDEVIGAIELSRNRLNASCMENFLGESCITGCNRYSVGTHYIRFRIKQKNDNDWFFGIVTASQKLTSTIYCSSSAYGWWEFDDCVMHGKLQEQNKAKNIRTGDEVIFILDCDNRLIQFQHHRTNRIVHIPVDLHHCPFPWKLVVMLFSRQDSISIIH